MNIVTIYTSPSCVYCNMAKSLLKSKNIDFTEIDVVANEKKREELVEKYKWRTVPMIMIGEKFIGGYDDLNKLNQAGQLEAEIGG